MSDAPERWRSPEERFVPGISDLVVTLLPDGSASIWEVSSDLELQYAKDVTSCTHWKFILRP